MTQDAAEIAKGLTKAQREALVLLDGMWGAGPQLPDQLLDGVLAHFRSMGLVEREFGDEGPPRYSVGDYELTVRLSACWHFRLTPLGLSVRRYLQEERK